MLALGAVDRPEMQHQTPGLGLSALLTRVPTTTPPLALLTNEEV